MVRRLVYFQGPAVEIAYSVLLFFEIPSKGFAGFPYTAQGFVNKSLQGGTVTNLRARTQVLNDESPAPDPVFTFDSSQESLSAQATVEARGLRVVQEFNVGNIQEGFSLSFTGQMEILSNVGGTANGGIIFVARVISTESSQLVFLSTTSAIINNGETEKAIDVSFVP